MGIHPTWTNYWKSEGQVPINIEINTDLSKHSNEEIYSKDERIRKSQRKNWGYRLITSIKVMDL